MKAKPLIKDKKGKTFTCCACCRYCRIAPGQVGYCGVRANDDGKFNLLVYGKPCAVWVDPVEKKPMFHFLPGTTSYSIGTFGCNFSCSFCFLPDSTIVNDDSIKSLEEEFDGCIQTIKKEHGEIGIAGDRKTITASGNRESISKVFRHLYEGDIVTIQPRHAPAITCTPEHRIFVYRGGAIVKVPAGNLKKGDLLMVPKLKTKDENVLLDSGEMLGRYVTKIRHGRTTPEAIISEIIEMKKSGKSSREIGASLSLNPSFVRGLLSRRNRGIGSPTHDNTVIRSAGRVRFKMEKGDGIPAAIPVDAEFAELIGYYCAEGHSTKCADRPSSFNVVFSYGKHEGVLIRRTAYLLGKIFGVKPKIVTRRTTITVEASKSSLGILLTDLCGNKSHNKKVPSEIARSKRVVIHSFMRAFLAGDGCVLKDSIAFNTVSRRLAMGLYHLLLLLGYLPSFYVWNPPKKKIIEGRLVNQSTLYYVKLKAEKFRESFLGNTSYKLRKKSEENLRFKETPSHWLVPVFEIEKKTYRGHVYNCEVEEEHSYLANFVAVCNCQNWDISQAPQEARLHDPTGWRGYFERLVERSKVSLPPEKVVENALAAGCRSIAYTYNEPTIFTEYALDVMDAAKGTGLRHVYVSNGYEAPECWDALKGKLDAVNIDLKAFDQKFYGNICKADMEPVKESIKLAKKRGIWVEITTLIVPGENDSMEELHAEAEWLAAIDKSMPWHITAFHPDYKMLDKEPTAPEILMRARELGKAAGLEHVYTGNVPFSYSQYETTYCPSCGKALVERMGFSVASNNITKGACRYCKKSISGIWE
jgi:AmmeMemoRadiSam system radical SAM enzyme